MNRRWLFGIIAALLALGATLFVRAKQPVLLDFSPADGDFQVAPNHPLTLTFSEPMNAESVAANLELQPPVAGDFSGDAEKFTFIPNPTWPRGERITVTLNSGAASQMGLPTLSQTSWSFETSPPLLTYLWPANGPADIYTVNLRYGVSQRLTETDYGVLNYDIDTNGEWIYFSTRLAPPDSAIFRLERATGEVHRVLTCKNTLCNNPKISPAGDALAYSVSPAAPESDPFPWQIWVLPIQDEKPAPVEQADLVSNPAHQSELPHWSPTGLLTFYDKTAQHFTILDLEAGTSAFFHSETGETGTWSPDGRNYILNEIIFWGNGPMDYTSHLWRFDYPASSSADLSPEDRTLEDSTPAYAPDGSLIAFGRKHLDKEHWIPGRQLWLMSPNGSNPRQITDAPDYNHLDFAWHPAGDYLAYVRYNQSAQTDPPELWIIRPDGSDAIRLVINAYAPQWLP